MYLPAIFEDVDPDSIARTIDSIGLAQLVMYRPEGLTATPVPLLRRPDPTNPERWTLVGHLRNGNSCLVEGEALVLFLGVESYVSPNLYPTKRDHGKVVPTWNYETVHVLGTLTLHRDPAWVLQLVTDLTNVHEAENPAPWKVSDAPSDYIEVMVTNIVGIELDPVKVTAKRKMSQNQPDINRDAVRQAFGAGTSSQQTMAQIMATDTLR